MFDADDIVHIAITIARSRAANERCARVRSRDQLAALICASDDCCTAEYRRARASTPKFVAVRLLLLLLLLRVGGDMISFDKLLHHTQDVGTRAHVMRIAERVARQRHTAAPARANYRVVCRDAFRRDPCENIARASPLATFAKPPPPPPLNWSASRCVARECRFMASIAALQDSICNVRESRSRLFALTRLSVCARTNCV